MQSKALHSGMIRGKRPIHQGLLQSQSTNRQLAVCYANDDKLLVKICTFLEVKGGKETSVILQTQGQNGATENITIALDQIESIYPISDFPH
jgi:hypothetical protein